MAIWILIFVLVILAAVLIARFAQGFSSIKYGGGLFNLLKNCPDDLILTPSQFTAIKCFFPRLPRNLAGKLRMTKEGVFSTTNPKLMGEIISIAENKIGPIKHLVVTDATANNGGSAICFAKKSKFVNAVEICPKTFAILENNVKLYDLGDKIGLHCADYTKIMNNLEQDLVFIDPPWGGLDYKSEKKVGLKLGELNMAEIANRLVGRARLLLFKVPANFDRDELADQKFGEISYHNVGKFLIVAIGNCVP